MLTDCCARAIQLDLFYSQLGGGEEEGDKSVSVYNSPLSIDTIEWQNGIEPAKQKQAIGWCACGVGGSRTITHVCGDVMTLMGCSSVSRHTPHNMPLFASGDKRLPTQTCQNGSFVCCQLIRFFVQEEQQITVTFTAVILLIQSATGR